METTTPEDTSSNTNNSTPPTAQPVSPAPPVPPAEKPKGRPLLKSEERKRCWAARDAYFACFDKKGQRKEFCEESYAQFEKDCPKKWMEHFEGIRMKAAFRKALVTEGVGYTTYESEADMAKDGNKPPPVYYDEKPLGEKK